MSRGPAALTADVQSTAVTRTRDHSFTVFSLDFSVLCSAAHAAAAGLPLETRIPCTMSLFMRSLSPSHTLLASDCLSSRVDRRSRLRSVLSMTLHPVVRERHQPFRSCINYHLITSTRDRKSGRHLWLMKGTRGRFLPPFLPVASLLHQESSREADFPGSQQPPVRLSS